MAKIYNPWESPPSTGTLSGDLASFEINDMEEPCEGSDDAMGQALKVIAQQSDTINKLMDMLRS